MDFDGAIKAHSAWKLKLSAYLRNPDGSLKADEIQQDNKCELGKWIYGEGAKFSNLPEFIALKKDHARFHKCAAEVVKKADSGAKVSDEVALGAKSDFANASDAIVGALMTMRRKA